MKPGKRDIKAHIKFELDELDLLQENTWQMAESFGLEKTKIVVPCVRA